MKWIALLLAAVLVALVMSHVTEPMEPAPARASLAPPQSVAATEPAQLPRAAAPAKVAIPAPRRESPVDPEWKADDPPATVVKHLRQTGDYREFVDRALRVGGGAHLILARQAIDRCRRVGEAGMAGAEQQFLQRLKVEDPQYQARLDAFRGLHAGCAGFEVRPFSRDEYRALQMRIDGERDAWAMADALVRSHIEPSQEQKVARTLIESDDQVLIGAVGYFLQRKQSKPPDRAWQLAACELGDLCGPTDPTTRSRCAFQGLCETAASDNALQDEKNQIVAAIRGRDWERLGL